MAQGSSSRGGKNVRLIVVHTAEGATDVSSLDSYFSRTQTGSSHAGADNNRLVEGWVPYDRAAWTLRSGNPISDNIELCGFAKTSRGEWLSKYDGMLTHCARWIAARCKARNIPCVKITAAQVRAGQSGVCGHIDWTEGMKDGSHWDPGPGFPWDVVMSRAQSILGGNAVASVTEDDMAQVPQEEWAAVRDQIKWLMDQTIVPGTQYGYLKPMNDKLDNLGKTLQGPDKRWDMLTQILSWMPALAQKGETGGIDVDALADRLSESLGADLATELGKKLAS